MKIQIVKSKRKDYWYADMIGEVFETVEGNFGINQFKVKRNPSDVYGNNWFVHSLDAIKLKE